MAKVVLGQGLLFAPGYVSNGVGRSRSRGARKGVGGMGSAPALDVCFLDHLFTWFERISMLVILLNCVTLGMFRPCEDIACDSQRCRILQVSVCVVGVRGKLLILITLIPPLQETLWWG